MNTNAKPHVLLLMAAALAMLLGIVAIHEIFAQNKTTVTTQRTVAAPRVMPPTAQQHWKKSWTRPIGDSLTGAPAAWSNGWVVTTRKGTFAALDNKGRMLWKYAYSNFCFAGSPVVAGSHVVAVSDDGDVLALEAATGKLLWRVKVDGVYHHGPIAVRTGDSWQVVLVSAADGVLSRLDLKDGRIICQSEGTNRTDGEPGCDGAYLAYGNCDAAVHIFSLTNCAQLAEVPVDADAAGGNGGSMPGGVMAGGVLVSHGRVYGGTGGGELICVDVAASNVAWRTNVASGSAFNTPLAAGSLILMGTRDGDVDAFDAQRGDRKWQTALHEAVNTLCVVDDAVFAVSGGALVGLRLADGTVFMKLPVGDEVSGPVWNGHTLVVAPDGGNVVGFTGE